MMIITVQKVPISFSVSFRLSLNIFSSIILKYQLTVLRFTPTILAVALAVMSSTKHKIILFIFVVLSL